MTRSQITTAVSLLKRAATLRDQAIAAEQSFATLHLVDDLRAAQWRTENEFTRLMRSTYERLTMAEGLALSKRLHRLAAA